MAQSGHVRPDHKVIQREIVIARYVAACGELKPGPLDRQTFRKLRALESAARGAMRQNDREARTR